VDQNLWFEWLNDFFFLVRVLGLFNNLLSLILDESLTVLFASIPHGLIYLIVRLAEVGLSSCNLCQGKIELLAIKGLHKGLRRKILLIEFPLQLSKLQQWALTSSPNSRLSRGLVLNCGDCSKFSK